MKFAGAKQDCVPCKRRKECLRTPEKTHTRQDALLIASPEYAHGVTGVMKNALDWMVSCEAFIHKPVALLNASPRAVHAQAALKETLIVMSASFLEDASITVPILGSNLSEDEIVLHPNISASLISALVALRTAVVTARIEAAATFSIGA
ncbi:protein of unknown function [Candidatus Nitrotoga arctica]|uniref:NADPH-dependent FMN reductase-like domain-containing protein n=1 Tax=Candidatus Nitrotoga arctica TaxID=453162 RepID=A0ABM8Z244_9PROT|nr:NAD(P)H-dependent oxidoreductase [Candidatus Nitrotoga arctica]CAG9933981.1 protein of unknown function [Candidatus Nitrotoga arctica]